MNNTTIHGPFVGGINNRAREYELPTGSVRDAVNVDLTLSGRTRLRPGQERVMNGDRVSSCWSDGDRAFYKDGATLREYFDNGTNVTRFTGLSNHAVAYAKWPGRGFVFSDASIIKRIVGTTILPIALATPSTPPIVTAGTAGSLAPGLYQVATSFQNGNGEESALTASVQVAVVANGSLQIGLPVAADADAVSTLLYVSATNGDQLYLATIVSSMTTSLALTVLPSRGREPITQHAEPLPAGDILAYWDGRLISSLNGVVRFTQPYSGLYNAARDYIAFPKPVSIIFPTDTGLWLVADHTYYLTSYGGDLRTVAPMGAVAGTLALLPDTDEALWMTDHGLVQTNGGELTYLQQDNVQVSRAQSGAAVYLENDGLKHVVATLRNPSLDKGGASGWFAASLHSGEVKDGLE